MLRNKRKRLLVNRRVQGALLWRLIVHWCFFFVVALLVVTAVHFFQFAPTAPRANLVEHFYEAIRQHAMILIVLCTLIPIFLRDLLRATHPVVGPIVKIESAIRELAQGGMIEPFSLRKDDSWKDLAAAVNSVAERIRKLEVDAARSEPTPTTPTPAPSDHEAVLV